MGDAVASLGQAGNLPMAKAATSLEVEELEVSYGAVRVLDSISLAVEGGEFVALLGSSGCGKTTLLRAICGFVAPQKGRIAVDGRDVTNLPPNKRNMAMVFQSYALWPHMNVAQNIGYGLRLRGVDRATIAARVASTLGMLRLDGMGERGVGEISGGQRQRVALGRALAINPQILLLDEPLSNLDARIREEVRHEIRTLQRELGITTIHVTHDREEAMVMADRIAILDKGRLAQLGRGEDIYNRPNSPFVAAFMGATNVIRLPARHVENGIAIVAGPHNAAATLAWDAVRGAVPERTGGEFQVALHFRSEEARLAAADAGANGALLLRGRIVQAAYPGGHYRYAVRVGDDQFLVDDKRRFAVDEAIGIELPLGAIHLYLD